MIKFKLLLLTLLGLVILYHRGTFKAVRHERH